MRPSRWPVRVRLTALYAGAFLSAGVVLVTATYWLVSRSLSPESHRPLGVDPASLHGSLDSEQVAAVDAAIDTYRSDTLNSLLTWSIIALVAALVVAVALGWVLAGRALHPLREITATATRVADRNLHERIGLAGPNDEVKQLADTIDEMLERLDSAFDAQRRFVANASHELRTPLAVNRTLLEVAVGDPEVSDDLRRLVPTLLTTNDRSERLVEALLTLARSEEGVIDRSAIDLAEVAAAAVDHEHHDAAEAGVTVTTDLVAAPVVGSPVLIERLAVNLVQNAVRHSPAGTETLVRTGCRDANSVLEVENPGPELRAYEIDELFEPFRRGNGRTSSRGVGLGLSIVRSVAQAHGGAISAKPRDGGGMTVRVELPTQR